MRALPFRLLNAVQRGGLLVLALPICFGLARGADAPAEEAALREFLKGRATVSAFVFSGSQFPKVHVEPAGAAERHLGRHAEQTVWYDAERKIVSEPKTAGAYFAILKLVPEHGREADRMLTFFKAAAEAPFARLDAASLEPVARWTGLSVAQLEKGRELLQANCQGQPMNLLAQNPGMARILAGLQRMPVNQPSVRKNDDALAWDRQAWVELKRQLSGADKQWPAVFDAPTKQTGAAAPEIHAGSLAEAGMNPDAAEIDAVCKEWAADSDQAFGVCIVRHGVIVLLKAYGTRDGHAMTLSDTSWMASVTKCFSATCMMMLVDRGLVALDDPVEKFLPELRGTQAARPLLVRNLYTHTSGLSQWPSWGDDAADLEEQVGEVYPYLKVAGKWEYGGQGNSLGCKMIERITGEALPLFYLRHVLEPLGMEHTDVLGAHADMQTTPLDIARFAQMLLNRGSYGGMQFMKPETFEQMLPQELTGILGPDATKTFGIGMDGEPGSGKFGHGAASSATFSVDTKEELVVIMCRNKAGTNIEKYNGKFWDAVHAGMAPPSGK